MKPSVRMLVAVHEVAHAVVAIDLGRAKSVIMYLGAGQVGGQLVTLANGTTATGLAATATDLYTLQSNGSILDTSVGSGTSSVLISGLSSPVGFAVEAAPEPSTWAMLLGGGLLLVLAGRIIRRASPSRD